MKHWVLAVSLALAGTAVAQEGTPGLSQAPEFGPRPGLWGINASFFGSALASINSGIVQTPTVGARFFLKESLALNLDAGFSVISSNNLTAYGFNAAGSVDIFLANMGGVRPFAVAGVAFGKGINTTNNDFTLELDGGFGAEYWFTQHFSLGGRLMLGIPMTFSPTVVRVSTFTPGIRATFYF